MPTTTRPPPAVPPSVQPNLRQVFAGFDKDGDDKISKGEVDQYLGDLGLGPGFTRRAAHDSFDRRFDTGTADGVVEWGEFVDNAHKLMPWGVRARGHVDPTGVDGVFDSIAGPGSTVANRAQLEAHVKTTIPLVLRLFSDVASSVTTMFEGLRSRWITPR